MGSLLVRGLGVLVVAGGLVLFERGLADTVDLSACREGVSRSGPIEGQECDENFETTIVLLLAAAVVFTMGLLLDGAGRKGRDGAGVIVPVAMIAACLVAASVLWRGGADGVQTNGQQVIAVLLAAVAGFVALLSLWMLTRRSRSD